MANVISFLEALGSARPQLVNASDYVEKVNALAAEAPVRQALLHRDVQALGVAMGLNNVMYALVAPAEPEPDRTPDDQPPAPEPAKKS